MCVKLRPGPGTPLYGAALNRASSTIVVVLSPDATTARTLAEHLIHLDESFEVHAITSEDRAAAHLDSFEPDVIVVDQRISPSNAALLGGGLGRRTPVLLFGDNPEAHQHTLGAGIAASVSTPTALGEAIQNLRRVSLTQGRLAETEQHYRDILEASSDGVFVQVDNVFRYVNSSLARVLGRDAAALPDKVGLLDFVTPSYRRAAAQALAKLHVSDGQPQLLEVEVQGAGRQPVRLEMNCRASVIDGKRTVVGVAREVTAIRQLEASMENARRRAAEAERLRILGELSAGVAHDFNNSLSTIIGRAQLALDKVSRGNLPLEELEVIIAAASTAARTVERIRAFSRPTGNESWQDVDLGRLINQAADFIATRVPPGVHLEVSAQPTVSVRGNFSELQEVLLNLLSNAIDAVGDRGTITLSCHANSGRAVLEVRDDGCGMSKAVQARLFEPFFSTKGGAGTGLGLTVSRSILRRHDAEMQVESAEGAGTTFRLVFVPPPAPMLTERSLRAATLNILICDDDHAVAEMISDLLEEEGHTVSVVGDPEATIDLLERRAADLLITDLDLPGMSGWELVRRAREKAPDLVVGLVTGWTLGASQAELKSRGVDFALTKPFSLADLEAALLTLRGERR